MNIVRLLFCIILGYLFYSVIMSKYKSSKRNELKYDNDSVRIPEHLCTMRNSGDEDLKYEEIELYCQNHVGNKVEKPTYKTVKWDDIKHWEYGFVTHMNFNHTIWLCITTVNETISVTDVHRTKMKRHFRKYAKEKQIANFSNKMEMWGIFLSFAIIILLTYVLFFRK